MAHYKSQKGFTLVEMLIAMAIFITFTGILISSYTSIVRSQREANDYRLMYSEARSVFESLTAELREGMVDYGNLNYAAGVSNGGLNELYLVSKDDEVKTHIQYDEDNGVIKVSKSVRDRITKAYSGFDENRDLNSNDVKITDLKFYVSPVIDPYDPQYVENDLNQFHPKVTIYAEFERVAKSGKTYTTSLQTTVSSRIYNQVYLP